MINIGDLFGDFKIVGEVNNNVYVCQCKCGVRKRIHKDKLYKYVEYRCNHKQNTKDITGQKFGDWIVIQQTKAGYWLCECQCENKTRKEIYGTTLRNGKSLSCGHSTTGFKDLTDKKFGDWLVLEYAGNHYWKCQCSCENKTVRNIHRYSLINGKSTSCGCKSVEKIQKSLIKNEITQYRTDKQIEIVSSYENMYNYIKRLGYKPTINELSDLLSLNRNSVGVYIHKYKLENYVDINSSVSEKEKEIRKFIESIYKGNIIYNSRIVIKGQELDIYIPDKRLAIEFNGNYWHSAQFKDKYYHQNKTIACAKQGIQLIHIFEYEWDNELIQSKIKSIIKDLLSSNKIYVKNTIIKEIDNKLAKDFEDKYNLYNGINGEYSFGCYYNNELICVMTIRRSQLPYKNQYEVLRFCRKPGIFILEDIDKMLKAFETKYKPESIICYIDLSKFKGNSYIRNGFSIDNEYSTEPKYILVSNKGNQIIHMNDEVNLISDKNQIEDEITKELRYLKIYNCGKLKLIKHCN